MYFKYSNFRVIFQNLNLMQLVTVNDYSEFPVNIKPENNKLDTFLDYKLYRHNHQKHFRGKQLSYKK